MLQVARLAPDLLQQAAERVAEFLRGQIAEDGGGKDRAGKSDLYYTVFLLEGLIALREELPVDRARPFLERHEDGEGLDLIHLCCLARCWAALGGAEPDRARAIGERIEAAWTRDSIYESFLAYGACQDLGRSPTEPDALARFIASLRLEDGSFPDRASIPVGMTPTTAAAVALLHQLGEPPPAETGAWLLARARPEGGFAAGKDAPIPDVLSTATALHALAAMKVPLGASIKEASLDFLDTLWTGTSFVGNWTDDELDSEYTYYALLSLGHLSLA